MKKALKIIAILILVLLIAIAGFGVWAYSYLTSNQFKQMIVDKTSEALGVKVTVESLKFSIFSGFQLKGVKIANPPGSRNPDFFQADSFELNYNWRALLDKKLEINDVSVQKPIISVEQLASGQWIFPGMNRLPHAPEGQASGSGDTQMTQAPQSSPVTIQTQDSKGIPVSVKKFEIQDGALSIYDMSGVSPISFKGMTLHSSVSVDKGKADLKGDLKISNLEIIRLGQVSGVDSRFELKDGVYTISEASATCFGGQISGHGTLDINQVEQMPLALDIKGNGLDMKSLLAALGNQTDQLSGKLNIEAQLTAPMTHPLDFQGKGYLDIKEGKVTGVPMLQLIGSVFNISEFQEMNLTKAYTDFSAAERVITLSNLILTTPDIQIKGGGTITVDNQYDLKLVMNMSKGLYEKMPNDIREKLLPNEDGSFTTPEFRVYGPQDSLKTDLLDKLLVQDAAKKQIQKLNEKAGDLLKELFK
ncbi:MAG: AsmA family protein [Verrucomicrobiota bacterium]|nr:AsmA family protein [Verrucomicrobiota bacterium]